MKYITLAADFEALPVETRIKLQNLFPRRNEIQRKELYSSDLPSINKDAKAFAKSWKCSANDVSIEIERIYDDYGDGSSSSLFMSINTLETDDQYFCRLLAEHHNQLLRDEYDRKEFERLKTKFK